jgi:hypothetical protein
LSVFPDCRIFYAFSSSFAGSSLLSLLSAAAVTEGGVDLFSPFTLLPLLCEELIYLFYVVSVSSPLNDADKVASVLSM